MNKSLIISALLLSAGSAFAQTPPVDSHPSVSLDAVAVLEVAEDTAIASVAVERQNPDVLVAQQQVNKIVSDALAKAKTVKTVAVKTGRIQTYPVYGKDGKITAWRVRNELILESREMADVSNLVASLAETMAIGNVGFKLSLEASNGAQKVLQEQAVKSFRAKAQTVTEQMGYSHYVVSEVRLNDASQGRLGPVPMMSMSRMAKVDMAGEVPMEAGKTTITVSVSGTIRLEN